MVLISFFVEKHAKRFCEGLQDALKDIYYVIGVEKCVKSWDNMFFWMERLLPVLHKMATGTHAGNTINISTDVRKVAKELVDIMWLIVEEAMKFFQVLIGLCFDFGVLWGFLFTFPLGVWVGF